MWINRKGFYDVVGAVDASDIVFTSMLDSVVKVLLIPKLRNSLRDLPDTNH